MAISIIIVLILVYLVAGGSLLIMSMGNHDIQGKPRPAISGRIVFISLWPIFMGYVFTIAVWKALKDS